MTSPRAFVLGCTWFAIVTSLSAAAPDPQAVDPFVELQRTNEKLAAENERLQRRVDELAAQNKLLQRRLGQLRVAPAPVPNPPQPFQMPGSGRRLGAPGSDWVPREFNGQTVYIVPCDTQGDPAGTSNTARGAAGILAVPATRPAAK